MVGLLVYVVFLCVCCGPCVLTSFSGWNGMPNSCFFACQEIQTQNKQCSTTAPTSAKVSCKHCNSGSVPAIFRHWQSKKQPFDIPLTTNGYKHTSGKTTNPKWQIGNIYIYIYMLFYFLYMFDTFFCFIYIYIYIIFYCYFVLILVFFW